MDDVHRAVREINEQAHLLAVRNAAPQEKLMLVAICNEVHLSGRVRLGRGIKISLRKGRGKA